jgi:EmrB/QacA subfamily drug resistance transporter
MMEGYTDKEKGWVLTVAGLGSFMVALDSLGLNTALATLRSDLGAPMHLLQWTVNAYNLSFAVLLMAGAALGDRFGRRRLFVAGLVLFMLASLGCALSTGILSLIMARALQGAAAALVVPLGMALLSAAFPREERARALGIFSGMTGLALIAGPAACGALTEGLGWPWIFWINLPIGIVLAALALTRLRESLGPAAGLDIPGLALIAGSAFGLVWALLRGNAAGWVSIEVLGSAAIGIILATGFVGWEQRTPAPVIPMRLFRARAFRVGVSASVLLYAAMYGALFMLPQFLQFGLNNGPFGAGLRLLPWTATLFVTAPIAGAVVSRFGERRLVVAGLAMQTAGFTWIALLVAPDVSYMLLVAPLIVAGIGVSMAMPAVQNAIMSSVAPVEMGKASGVFNMGRFLGGMFGVALLVASFSATGADQTPQQFGSGFAFAMMVAAILSACGMVAGSRLPAPAQIGAAQMQPGA